MRDDVQKWLDEVRGRHEATLALSLRHHRDTERNDQVDAWDLPKDLDATALWAKVEESAQQDADLLGGTQRYAIVVLNGKEVCGRRLVTLEGRIESGGPADPANERGVVAMLMRQNEAKDRFAMRVMSACIEGIVSENRRLTSRVETLELRDEERGTIYEKLRSKQHERELATATAKHDQALKQEVVHGIRMLLPQVVAKATGKPVPPDAARPEDESLKALLESIRPEQFEKLSEILNPFQQATLFSFWQQHVAGEGQKDTSKTKGSD